MDFKTLYTVPAELLGDAKMCELQQKLSDLAKARQEIVADTQKKIADLIPTDAAIDAEIAAYPEEYQGPIATARDEARLTLLERYAERDMDIKDELSIGLGEIDGTATELREQYGLCQIT